MKKVLFTLAIAGMFGFVACNNNKPAEEAVEEPIENVEAIAEENAEAVENAVEEVVENAEEVATEAAAQ